MSIWFHVILCVLFLFHFVDGFRSLCALFYIFLLQKSTSNEKCNSSDDSYFIMQQLIEDKRGLKYVLCSLYEQLAFNDLIFIVTFITMHFVILGEGGIQCRMTLLTERGTLLQRLLNIYWTIIISMVSVCCCWRCMCRRDTVDSSEIIVQSRYQR
jgi:hypothetical protein